MRHAVIVGVGTLVFAAGCASPECGPGTTARDGRCVPVASDCGDGEVLFDGKCLRPLVCGAGTTLVDGACVPDLVCGPGTVAAGGVCTAVGLPPVDLLESSEPAGTVSFTLPAPGASLTLGGVVDTPRDTNADGWTEPDWDRFTFTGRAGTYLRLTALAEGPLLAAFRISSLGQRPDGQPLYLRWVFDLSDADAVREVYLPRDDTYAIEISDTNHVVRALRQEPVLPVGGDAFVYRLVVENLGSPQPTFATTLPYDETGDARTGRLIFVHLPGASDNTPLAISAEGRPNLALWNDVIPALLVFDDKDTLVAEVEARGTGDTPDLLLRPGAGESLLAVLDTWAMVGPETSCRIRAERPRQLDCGQSDCAQLSFAEQENVLLRWELAAGQHFAAGVYLPETSWRALNVSLLDGELARLWPDDIAYFPGNSAQMGYAERPETFYLWLREYEGVALEAVAVEARVTATAALVPGHDYTGLGMSEMPPWTFWPAGLAHVADAGGKVVFFSDFTPTGPGWHSPTTMIVDRQMREMGGVVDLGAWDFPDGRVTPPFVWLRPGAHALHTVVDPYGDPSIATYDLKVRAYEPVAIGRLEPGQSDRRTLQGLGGGFRFYAVEAAAGTELRVTVTPGLLSNLTPEIWVMNYGAAEWIWIWYEWRADPDAPQLGLVEQVIGAGQGLAAELRYTSPYDGPSLVLVMDGEGSAGLIDTYTIDVVASAGGTSI